MKQIVHRWTLVVLFTATDATTIAKAVKAAITAGADLSRADLRCAILLGANLRCAILLGADLSCAILRCADLSRADLRCAILRNADLRCAILLGANLSCAILRNADLSRADLRCAILRGADLSDAILRGADLSDTDLSGANLSCADLRGANLSRANLSRANLSGANLSDSSIMPDGRPWSDYRLDHMAGVCSTPEIKAKAVAAWGKHTWQDCPLHCALGITSTTQAENPSAAAAWVALYDGKHLVAPVIEAAE